MDKSLMMDVALDTASFAVSSVGLQKLGQNVHMGAKDYLEYIAVDTLYRYMKFNCDVPISSYANLNHALYRILVLGAGKSVLDIALGREGKIKQNFLAIGISEPARAGVDYIRSRF